MSELPPIAYVKTKGEPITRRWVEQRWLLDNVIKANGIDWDQPRSIYLNLPCGMEAGPDFAGLRQRVQKYADVANAFEAAASRREGNAKAAAEAGESVTARENYFIAAILWGAGQWPFDQADDKNIAFNERKRRCYGSYARLADHRIEPVVMPFQGKSLTAWLHLPYGYEGGRVPAVVVIPGMDSFKEGSVALYGDRWLSRGIAVLAVDGPGQYEAPLLGVHVSIPAWQEAAKLWVDWLIARPEIDPERIGLNGASFGSFFATVAVAAEPRYKAVAVFATCLEPGCHAIFEEASPTFKKRFMFMSGILDEAEFDAFRRSLTWEGHAERIKAPYLCLAGESDELSPLEHTERMFAAMTAPRQLVVYMDARHALGGVPSTILGPPTAALQANWMAARLAGKSFASERWFVDGGGRVTRTAF
jgi:dienelactone hydrolase